MAAVVATALAAIVGGTLIILISQPASLRVTTSTVSPKAGEAVTFEAHVSLPLLTSPGSMSWNFGDSEVAVGETAQVTHLYRFAGTFFVAASMNLGNGRSVDNFDALLPVTIGASSAITDRDALGRITIDSAASSPGAPVVAPGGNIAAVGDALQGPTNSSYNWAVTSLEFDFGDGSAREINASADPFPVQHTYSSSGLRTLVLYVTTRNLSSSGVDLRVTSVGQTIAVGPYKLATDSGSALSASPNLGPESLQRELRLMGFFLRVAVELP